MTLLFGSAHADLLPLFQETVNKRVRSQPTSPQSLLRRLVTLEEDANRTIRVRSFLLYRSPLEVARHLRPDASETRVAVAITE